MPVTRSAWPIQGPVIPFHRTREHSRVNRTSRSIFAEKCASLDPMLLRNRLSLQKRVARILRRGRQAAVQLNDETHLRQAQLPGASECPRTDDPKLLQVL